MVKIEQEIFMERLNVTNLPGESKEILIKAIEKIIDIIKNPEEFEKNLLNSESFKSEFITTFPSVCLILGEFMELFTDKETWEKISHEYIERLRKTIYRYNDFISAGLFGGLCDIGFGVYALYKGTDHYKKFIDSLNQLIIDRVNEMLVFYSGFNGKIFAKQYDTMVGLSGILGYLLLFKDDIKVKKSINGIIEYFVQITQDIEVLGYKVPGWYISSENQYLIQDKMDYKEGNFNLGLSHGISGIAVSLSLALDEGFDLLGQRDVIKKILNDLKRFKYQSEEGAIYWSGRVSFRDYIEKNTKNVIKNRAGWCYGTPGIARTMYISGKAIGDNDSIDIALNAMQSICKMNEDEWMLDSPTICHGLAGLLAIVNLMYKDTKNDVFAEGVEKISNKIFTHFDINSLYGFNDVESIYNNDIGHQIIKQEKFALLEGSTGVILAILSTRKSSRTNWERHLLIN